MVEIRNTDTVHHTNVPMAMLMPTYIHCVSTGKMLSLEQQANSVTSIGLKYCSIAEGNSTILTAFMMKYSLVTVSRLLCCGIVLSLYV